MSSMEVCLFCHQALLGLQADELEWKVREDEAKEWGKSMSYSMSV